MSTNFTPQASHRRRVRGDGIIQAPVGGIDETRQLFFELTPTGAPLLRVLTLLLRTRLISHEQ